MPIVRVGLFPGRGPEKESEIAREIAKTPEVVAGIKPADTTDIFSEASPADWIVAGEALGRAPAGA